MEEQRIKFGFEGLLTNTKIKFDILTTYSYKEGTSNDNIAGNGRA